MKPIKVALILLASSLTAGLSQAQTVQAGNPGAATVQLGLKEALNYAIQNNENVKKAHLNIEAGRYKTQEVRASALPQITGTGTFSDQIIKQQLFFNGQAIQVGTTYNTSAQAQLSQQLFNQQVFTGLKAAKSSEDYYNLNAQLTEEGTIEQVSTNYYQILVNRQKLAVIDTNIKNVQRIEKIVSTQYQNGLAKKIDHDRVKVNITNLQNQRQQLINSITQQENMLKYFMGMPVNTNILIPAIELNQINPIAQDQETEHLNPDNRTEFQIIKKQEELLGLQKKARLAEYYPTLSLSGNYSYNGLSNQFNFKGSTWYDMAAVGLTLRIPIFDGFATRSRVRQAEVDILRNKEDQKNLSNSLNTAYENAKIQIKNSLSTIKSQGENVKLAQEVYASIQNNYRNGLAGLTDLLDAENALTAAQNSHSEALLNYKLAEIQLIKSKGNIKSLLN
ncbi:MAG TPA: TolC family protein [Daejeonella sp.]|nr:TolC family protein [Daejeonella sp.]